MSRATALFIVLSISLHAQAGFFDDLKEQVDGKVQQALDKVSGGKANGAEKQSAKQQTAEQQPIIPSPSSQAPGPRSTAGQTTGSPPTLNGLEYDADGRIVLRRSPSYEQKMAFDALIAKVALGQFPELLEKYPIAFATETFLSPQQINEYVEKDKRKLRDTVRAVQANFAGEVNAYCNRDRSACLKGSNAFELKRTKAKFLKNLKQSILDQAQPLPLQFRSVTPLRLEQYDFDKKGFFIGLHTPYEPFHHNTAWELDIYKLHFSSPESRISRYWYLDDQQAEAVMTDESLRTGSSSHLSPAVPTVYASTTLQVKSFPNTLNALSAGPQGTIKGVEKQLMLHFTDAKVELYGDPNLERRMGQIEMALPPEPIIISGVPETVKSDVNNELNGLNIAMLVLAQHGDILDNKAINVAQKHQLMLDMAFYNATENIPNSSGGVTSAAPLSYAPDYQPFFPPGTKLNDADLLSESGDDMFIEWAKGVVRKNRGRYYVKTSTRMDGKGTSSKNQTQERHIVVAFSPYQHRNRNRHYQVTETLRKAGVMASQLAMLPVAMGSHMGDFLSQGNLKREVLLVLPNEVDRYTTRFYDKPVYEQLTGTQEARIYVDIDNIDVIPVDQNSQVLALFTSPQSVAAYKWADDRSELVVERDLNVAELSPDQLDLRSHDQKVADEKLRRQQEHQTQKEESQRFSKLESEMNEQFQLCHQKDTNAAKVECVDRICPEVNGRAKANLSANYAASINNACERREANELAALQRSYDKERREEKRTAQKRAEKDRSHEKRMQEQNARMAVMTEMKAKLQACQAQPEGMMECIQKTQAEMRAAMNSLE